MIRVIGVGAGGHAKVILGMLRLLNKYQIIGLLDPKKELWGQEVMGIPVLGNDSLLKQYGEQGIRHAFLGVGSVGDTSRRRELYARIQVEGFEMISAIHPKATLDATVTIGHSATIMAGVIVNAASRLGDNIILNTAAVVEHDCIIGDHVHIATGAKLASTVWVGEGAHIGIGASIRQGVKIGARAVVGAGSVVIKDVPPQTVVVGVPARPLIQKTV